MRNILYVVTSTSSEGPREEGAITAISVTADKIKVKTFQKIAQGYLYMIGIRQNPFLTLSGLAVRPAPVQIRFLFCLIYTLDCKIS